LSESTPTKFSPAFQRLWTASAASNLADGLLRTAAPLLATTLTKDPFWISTIAALSMLPWLFFAIPIGGLVDRINRRNMLAIANTLRLTAVMIIAITVGLDLITLPILLAAIFIFGVGEVIYDTTLQSMMPEVLTKDQLDRGNARLQIVGITLAEFIGAPVSGLLFAAAIALPFYFGAAGILVAVFLVLSIPRAYSIAPVNTEPKAKTGFWEDVRFGIRYLYEDKTLLKLVLLTSSIGFFFAASSSTMVLFMTETLKTPVALFGFLFAAPAVGALVGSMLTPKISARFGRTTTMAWAIVLSSLLVVIQGFSPNYWVLAGLVSLGSMIITAWNILLMSSYHQIIPGELFGRIHGTRRTLVWGMMPIGSLLGGAIASIDLRLPFIAGGLACSILAIWGFRFIINLENSWINKESKES
jgi:MFS family permease